MTVINSSILLSYFTLLAPYAGIICKQIKGEDKCLNIGFVAITDAPLKRLSPFSAEYFVRPFRRCQTYWDSFICVLFGLMLTSQSTPIVLSGPSVHLTALL